MSHPQTTKFEESQHEAEQVTIEEVLEAQENLINSLDEDQLELYKIFSAKNAQHSLQILHKPIK